MKFTREIKPVTENRVIQVETEYYFEYKTPDENPEKRDEMTIRRWPV